VKSFETDLTSVPSKYLCSEQCPCPPVTATNNWYSLYTKASSFESQYSSFVQRADQKFKRNFTITSNLTEYRNAITNNRNPPLFVSSTLKNYDNFFSCYLAVIELENVELSKNKNYQRRIKPVPKNFETFARDFESALSCNGICFPGLFFYFKPITEGPPMKNCIEGITTLFKDKPLAIGILLLVSFVLTVFAHINSYPICACSKCCQAKPNVPPKK